jgi:hypothetical protein
LSNAWCEKHGTPFEYEESRDHPGKSIQFCPTCRSEPSEFRKAILAQNPKVRRADPMAAIYRGLGVLLLAALALSLSGCRDATVSADAAEPGWQEVAHHLYRHPVPGGWLYSVDLGSGSASAAFVPEPKGCR